MTATMNIMMPITINDDCTPKMTENTPNKSTPTISHTFPTNSATPEMVPSWLGLVQSEIYDDTTGRINASPNEIANVMIMIFRNHSLYQSNR